ncbi:MAG: hypothetical protein ACR2I2_13475 [Bryobacteraceae bacterium]
MRAGSSELSDEEFLAAVDSAALHPSQFRHADHLRLAWLYLRQTSLENAERLVRSGIERFAERHGVADIYNETVTLAWVRLISTHRESSFAEFLSENESRLNSSLLHRFWTPELLTCDRAKREWVPPDRQALPA